MPNEVIDSIHALSWHDPRRIIFSDCNGWPLTHDDASDEIDDNTYLRSDTDDRGDYYPSENYEHGGDAAPPICNDVPTGVYDYHDTYTLDDYPPGVNQGIAAIKE